MEGLYSAGVDDSLAPSVRSIPCILGTIATTNAYNRNNFFLVQYVISSWKMSLSYGYGGAITGLGVVGLCTSSVPSRSRCLLIAML